MRRLVATCFIAAALSGCATDHATDPLQVTDTLVAAEPARSPAVTTPPAGTVVPAPAAQHTALTPDTHTLAVTHGTTLALHDTRDPGAPPRTVALPGEPASLHPGDEPGALLVAIPDRDVVATVSTTTGAVHTTPVAGGPVDAVDTPHGRAVALRDQHSVVLLRDGTITHRTGGFAAPTRLISTAHSLTVLDELATSVTTLDPRGDDKGAALRAGDGATRATSDRYERVLAVDTRGGELLAFSTDPLIMKQRYPVPGSPYGLAYDPARDLAWITTTATNELLGFDIAGGEPVLRHRLPTVHQPDNVTVDPTTGTVYVASATGQGIQVVRP